MNFAIHITRFLKITMGLACLAALTILCSCSKQDQTLLGEWIPVPEANHFRVKAIRFAKTGDFYFDEAAGKWEIKEGNKVTLIFPNVLPNTYEFEFSQDGKLILKDQAGIAGEFTRAGRPGI